MLPGDVEGDGSVFFLILDLLHWFFRIGTSFVSARTMAEVRQDRNHGW